jgi:hypothetical protein
MSPKFRPPTRAPQPTSRERQLSGHIFAVSAGLVGVCLTVVGLFHIFRQPGMAESIADNLVAMDAMVFLFACLFAYLALRSDLESRWRRLERYADVMFLGGISAMVVIIALIAYELI